MTKNKNEIHLMTVLELMDITGLSRSTLTNRLARPEFNKHFSTAKNRWYFEDVPEFWKKLNKALPKKNKL